ncbi:hypothetical protein [Rhodococcus sp. 27YEA15]|uniref:hypothetical protein n=1 Tax=Rhodococcus sp. 27YEA15 TaxID=3156259 RepID=UPI003C7D456E
MPDSVASENLGVWLSKHMPLAENLTVDKFERPGENGFSNITVLIDASWTIDGVEESKSMVARIEPTGETLFRKYDVEFQFKVMKALADSEVPGSECPLVREVERRARRTVLRDGARRRKHPVR